MKIVNVILVKICWKKLKVQLLIKPSGEYQMHLILAVQIYQVGTVLTEVIHLSKSFQNILSICFCGVPQWQYIPKKGKWGMYYGSSGKTEYLDICYDLFLCD